MNRAALLFLTAFVFGVLVLGTIAVRAAVNALGAAVATEVRSSSTAPAPSLPSEPGDPIAEDPAPPEPVAAEEASAAEESPEVEDPYAATPTDDPAAAPSITGPAAEPWEAPAIAWAEYAVFHHEKRRGDPWRTLQKVARPLGFAVYRGEAPDSARPPYVELRDLPTAEYEVVGGDTLKDGRGLNEADQTALLAAEQVTVLSAVMPLEGAPLLAFSTLLARYTQATGGVLWDEEAHEYLSLDAWNLRRVESWEGKVPLAPMHYTVFSDEENGSVSLTTSGLRHFGAPELRLVGVRPRDVTLAGALLHAVGQAVVEQRRRSPGPFTVDLSRLQHRGYKQTQEERCTQGALKRLTVTLTPNDEAKHSTLDVELPGTGAPGQRIKTALRMVYGTQPSR